MKALTFAIIASGLAVPATAEKNKQAVRQDKFARTVMRNFAACAVRNEPVLARTFVLMPDNERLNEADFQRLAGWRCLGTGRLKMQRDYFRGALADVLIRQQLNGSSPTSFASVAPLIWADPEPVSTVDRRTGKLLGAKTLADARASYARAVALKAVAQLGECVVRADPAGAKAVLATEFDDATEVAALTAMSRMIGGCVTKGQTLAFNRTNLRNAIAISYYRLANGSAPVTPTGANL